MKAKIRLCDLRIKCFIGCTDEEREEQQLLAINVTCTLDLSKLRELDNIHATDMLDYDQLHEVVSVIVEASRYHTLEALGFAIAHDVLMLAARPTKVKVCLAKFEVFDDCWPEVKICVSATDLEERRKMKAP